MLLSCPFKINFHIYPFKRLLLFVVVVILNASDGYPNDLAIYVTQRRTLVWIFAASLITAQLLPRMACLLAATFIKARSELSASEPTLFTQLATRGCCQNGAAELTSLEASLLFLQPVNFVKLPILVSKLRSHYTASSYQACLRLYPFQPAIT